MTEATVSREARRVLAEAGGARPMLWVMAIMVFLTALASAMGFGTATAAASLDRQLAGRWTVQVVDADVDQRDRTASRIVALLRRDPAIARVDPVDPARLRRLLQPWLGTDGDIAGLPVPALIDVDLQPGLSQDRAAAAVRRLQAAAPGVRVDAHDAFMQPVNALLATATWLAFALVLMMAAATTVVVMLTARAALDTHRSTIDVLHMLGSTDIQIARLFQTRVALDTLIGGVIGAAGALLVVLLMGARLSDTGSALLGGIALSDTGWAVLVLLPLIFTAVATLAARIAIVNRLRKTL